MTVAEELLRRTVVSTDLEQSLVKTARNHAATMLREIPKDAGRAPELVERVHSGNVHVVKASVALPAASPADVLAMFHTSTTARYQEFMARLFGDVVLDGLVIHDKTLSATETMTLHWLALHSSTERPRDYVYAQYTAQVQSHVVCVWESVELSPWVPLACADRRSFRQCGFVIADGNGGGNQSHRATVFMSETAPSDSVFLRRLAATVATNLPDTLASFLAFQNNRPSFFALHAVEEESPCTLCHRIMDEDRPKVECSRCRVVCCLDCSMFKLIRDGRQATPSRLCRSCGQPPLLESIVVPEPAAGSPSWQALLPPEPPASNSKGGGTTAALSRHVKKRFKIDATDALEADMRDVGRDAIHALLETQALPFLPSVAPSSLKLAANVVLSETAPMPRVFTIKAVIQLPRFNLLDVMALLDMRSTALFRDTMQTLLTSDFVDGVVLHAVPPMHRSAESLTINWLALHNAKAHLPPRDYVFLKYGDCIRRRSRDSVAPTKDTDVDVDMIGISAWESVDLPNCAELPESLHVLRMVFRRCGYIVEPTAAGLSVSFFISDVHQTRSTVSSMTKTWLQRLATSVALLRDAIILRFFAEQKLHSDPRAVVAAAAAVARDNDHCVVCSKRFTLLRRKSHCMLCGSVVCKACMEGTQGSGNNRLRACVACCAPSKVCLRKYWAADMTASAASSTSESSET
ncbi:unnamed protein product [Aphanomyces euteiches]